LIHPLGRCFVYRGFFGGGKSGPSLLLGRMNFLGGIVAARGPGDDAVEAMRSRPVAGSGGMVEDWRGCD
jgi:hypothetical protein